MAAAAAAASLVPLMSTAVAVLAVVEREVRPLTPKHWREMGALAAAVAALQSMDFPMEEMPDLVQEMPLPLPSI